jgi:hypothetical protein
MRITERGLGIRCAGGSVRVTGLIWGMIKKMLGKLDPGCETFKKKGLIQL